MSPRLRALLALGCLAAGCPPCLTIEGTRCDNGTCPAGYACVDGLCASPAGGGAGGGGTGGGTGGGGGATDGGADGGTDAGLPWQPCTAPVGGGFSWRPVPGAAAALDGGWRTLPLPFVPGVVEVGNFAPGGRDELLVESSAGGCVELLRVRNGVLEGAGSSVVNGLRQLKRVQVDTDVDEVIAVGSPAMVLLQVQSDPPLLNSRQSLGDGTCAVVDFDRDGIDEVFATDVAGFRLWTVPDGGGAYLAGNPYSLPGAYATAGDPATPAVLWVDASNATVYFSLDGGTAGLESRNVAALEPLVAVTGLGPIGDAGSRFAAVSAARARFFVLEGGFLGEWNMRLPDGGAPAGGAAVVAGAFRGDTGFGASLFVSSDAGLRRLSFNAWSNPVLTDETRPLPGAAAALAKGHLTADDVFDLVVAVPGPSPALVILESE